MDASTLDLPASNPSPRLLSLDALRGFDMCWILGLEDLVKTVSERWPDNRVASSVTTQLEHVDWAGFHFYDLIFPLFLFLSGVSMSISIPRRRARYGSGRTALHLVVRGLALVLLGAIYYGGLEEYNGNWPDALAHVRWVGVLQRIGVASACAGLLSLWCGARGLLAILIAVLAGYWALLTYVPVPGTGAGNYAEGLNLANYVDRIWLPGRRWDGDHDPEGLLSTLPAIGSALLGILAGKFLFSGRSAGVKVAGLILCGGLLVAAGWAWHPYFPVIKKLWTSSFVLYAGGWSMILLGVFYGVVDGLGWRRWAAPLVWVGANPIALYVAAGLGFFSAVAERLVGDPPGQWQWLPELAAFLLMLAVARFLYRRGVHIRV